MFIVFDYLQRNLISVDPVTKAKSGLLLNAIYHRRRRANRLEKSIINQSLLDMSDEQKDSVKNYFKTCILPTDKENVKVTMSQYKDFRMDLIQNSFDEYKTI